MVGDDCSTFDFLIFFGVVDKSMIGMQSSSANRIKLSSYFSIISTKLNWVSNSLMNWSTLSGLNRSAARIREYLAAFYLNFEAFESHVRELLSNGGQTKTFSIAKLSLTNPSDYLSSSKLR